MATSFHDFDVPLYRDSLSRPWGFRIQGGADYNFPLTVQRVFSGSPSESKLLRGDVIIALDGYDVGRLTHKQAQDVVRVAGVALTIRVRRAGPAPGPEGHGRRPHSTTPRQDPSAFFASNQPPRPTWHPPAPAGPAPVGFGNFGVQYGPSKASAPQPRAFGSSPHSPHLRTDTPPGEEGSALRQVQDSLNKLAMNHVNNEDEVDYSFTKKSVSERRKLFQQPSPQESSRSRIRSTSCTPTIRAHSYATQFSAPGPYTPSPAPAPVMSSSYTEGSRGRGVGPRGWHDSGRNFGWGPSAEKLAAARNRPASSVSQVQHSVVRSRDSSRESSPEAWRGMGGAPLMRSTSVSVLQESPTRATIHRYAETAPRQPSQRLRLSRGAFHEVGRWSISARQVPYLGYRPRVERRWSQHHAPTSPSWRVAPASPAQGQAKKFSTSATIQVGHSPAGQSRARVVRRFSTSSATYVDGTMSLDRRNLEPLRISMGTSWNADYHPAYPANVYQHVDRSWQRPVSYQPQRSASQKAPSRSKMRSEIGTYRPLQQSYASETRSAVPNDPDYMSSDF